jgi:hypothetical protein
MWAGILPDVCRVLGGQLRVVGDQVNRGPGGQVGQELTDGGAGRRGQLDLSLIGADRHGPTIVRTAHQSSEALALRSGKLEGCHLGHAPRLPVIDTNTTSTNGPVDDVTP